jgi:ketosteroid isomerase-like protein
MSEESVEVARAMFEAYREGGADSILDHLAPDVEWEVRADLPDADVYRGHEGFRRLIAGFTEVTDEMWYRPEELISAGEGQVVVPIRWGGRGRGSGVEFEERRETWVLTVRAGKVARVREFATRDEALQAVGLGG